MSLELTATAKVLSRQTNINSQIILEIDGIPVIFGAIEVTKVAKYGEGYSYGDPGLVYGGLITDVNQRNYISLDGTSYTLQQQIKPDDPSVQSVQKFRINLVDKDGEVTRLFKPGVYVTDVLGSRAKIYVSFLGAAHPDDSILILDGIIDELVYGAGNVLVSVSHPDDLKRSKVFDLIEDSLKFSINDTQTSIELVNADGLFESQDLVTTYVRIDDEIIEVGSISGNVLNDCVRGQLTTVAASHDAGNDIKSFYRLQGNPIEIALKLLLSDREGNFYAEEIQASSVSGNSIFFNGIDLVGRYGVTVGDSIATINSLEVSNNFTNRTVISVEKTDQGTTLIVDGASLVAELETLLQASFYSQYNTLADGAKLKPNEVDVAQFQNLLLQYNTSFFDYDFYLKDTVEVKSFIDEQVFFPSGLFPVPRKGRVSVNITVPPVAERETKILSQENITNADKLQVNRSTNKNFYNAIVYRFEDGALEDEVFRGEVTFSQTSANRIDTRNKPLEIEALGLRDTEDTREKIARQTRRFLDRFQFAAEEIVIDTNYSTGFSIEVSDTVILELEDLSVADQETGARQFIPRVYQVLDKSINLKTGKITFKCLNTNFAIKGRYGTIGPSSRIVGAESTVSSIKIKTSFGTTALEVEQDKWLEYLGQEVTIHNEDWTFIETTVLTARVEGNTNLFTINPPLSIAPLEDYILDMPDYPNNTDSRDRFFWKQLHCFFDPSVEIVSGISDFIFEVSPSDISKFVLNQPVRVHNDDYSIDSSPSIVDDDAEVISIDAILNRIEVNRSLGFTPASGQRIELIGFIDNGSPYRFL